MGNSFKRETFLCRTLQSKLKWSAIYMGIKVDQKTTLALWLKGEVTDISSLCGYELQSQGAVV